MARRWGCEGSTVFWKRFEKDESCRDLHRVMRPVCWLVWQSASSYLPLNQCTQTVFLVGNALLSITKTPRPMMPQFWWHLHVTNRKTVLSTSVRFLWWPRVSHRWLSLSWLCVDYDYYLCGDYISCLWRARTGGVIHLYTVWSVHLWATVPGGIKG